MNNQEDTQTNYLVHVVFKDSKRVEIYLDKEQLSEFFSSLQQKSVYYDKNTGKVLFFNSENFSYAVGEPTKMDGREGQSQQMSYECVQEEDDE